MLALLETQRGQAELCHQVNNWNKKHTRYEQGLGGHKDDPNDRHHEMFAPIIIGKRDGEYEHVTMALLDSGNLLQQPAINAKLHQTLGVGVVQTNVVARGANQLSIGIKGISEGIYLRFPNIRTSFFVRPLVVENLASPLNLGSKFNFEFMLTPQLVEQNRRTGVKSNHYELQGQRGRLFPRTVTVANLKLQLQGDDMFMEALEKWPDEGKIGQDTLTESQRKWVKRPQENPRTINGTFTESREGSREILHQTESERNKGEGSPHLAPVAIGLTKAFEISESRTPTEESNVERIRRLARLTTSSQHYDLPEAEDGLEVLPTPISETKPATTEVDNQTPTMRRPEGIPPFSLKTIEMVRKFGTTHMDHYVGRNLEDRGGLDRVTQVAQNYIDSLDNIALDRPPSCQEPDRPGQGRPQNELAAKHEPTENDQKKGRTYQVFESPYNSCNTCHHDLPPQANGYTEMGEVPFTVYQTTMIKPGYQDTLMISAILPTEGVVLLEPHREKRSPLLAMPHAIGSMTNKYNNAEMKADLLGAKRRQMKMGQYVVYNMGEDPIYLNKGETLGHCTLIYQDSMEEYMNEMGHMSREAQVDKQEWKRKKTRKNEDRTQTSKGPCLSAGWVEEAFRLSNNEVLRDKPELKKQLIDVLRQHGSAFDGGPYRDREVAQQGAGRTHWITARVELNDDNKGPIHCKQRRMHPHDEELLSSQLALWIEQGVIEPCESQWNSALLSVAKKDSTLKRFCIDLRPLNKQCKKLSVFQGSIDTNLDRLHGSVLYSAFDMSSGFMAVPLDAESKQYFAFTTPKQGTYAFTVLPFGWVNSPAFYARFINRLVSTMPIGSTLAYVDDILLHSKEASGIHMVQLIDQFLTRVEQSGAKIQVNKTDLMKDQVNYLGFIVGRTGITMNRQYRSALLDFPPPKSGKEMARFLGMVGFYRQFLPKLSDASAKLHTKKFETPWTPMSEEDLADFYKIKDMLINSEALASPDFKDLDKRPLIMGLDFSIQALCVTISQVQTCLDGQERRRLLFCSGRKCSPSGRNWSSHHGESATFIWGLTTFAWLLKRAPFLVETDSMSVKYIDNMKSSRGVHARWAEMIGSYSFTITHARVVVEDCVSRCPAHLPEPTQKELDMEKDWEEDPPPHLDLERLANQSAQLPIRPERICQVQENEVQACLTIEGGKIGLEWEQFEGEQESHQDKEVQDMEQTISELHNQVSDEPGMWTHDWKWTQPINHPRQITHQESHLGAAEDGDLTNDGIPDQVGPRRSRRAWAPTQRALEAHGQRRDTERTRWQTNDGTTSVRLPPEREPMDEGPVEDEPQDPLEPPEEAPPIEIGRDDLNLTPPQDEETDHGGDIVLEPAVDQLGRPLDPAAEGVGEPDPLVLARSPATLMSTTHQLIPGPASRAAAQDQDPVLAVVKDWVRQRVMPTRLELDFGDSQLKAYVKVIPALRLCQLPAPDNLDILVKTDIHGEKESERYCMPEKLINSFIKELHLRLSHYGVETVVLTMKHLVWFPDMWARVRQVLQVCAGCVQKHHKQLDKRVAGCYYPREKGNVASHVHLDLAGPLPRTPDDCKYILGIQCNFSGYCVAVPIKNKEHETVVKGFLDHWVYRFGPPVALVSDNEWTSQAFDTLCRSFQIEQRRTPFYNPRSNAQIERTFGTLKRLLRATTRGLNQGAWGDWLPPTVFSLNITVSKTTGISPYQLVHGTDPPIPLSTVVGVPEKTQLDPAEYMLTLSTNMGRLLITARDSYQVYIRRTADSYITPSPLGSKEPLGMRVWCWSPYRKKGTSGALSAKWSGPWRIVQFKPPALTLLQSEWLHRKGKPEVQREAVIDKIRPYVDTDDVQEDLEDEEIAMVDGDEESTDPYVDATDVLDRIHLITCRKPKKKRKTKRTELIKDEGEGDWGTGEPEPEERPVHKGDLQLLPTEWHPEFYPLRPRRRSGEVASDAAKLTTDQETPDEERMNKEGPANKGEKAEPWRAGRPVTSGRSNEGGQRQNESVSPQQPGGQHTPNTCSTGPELMGERPEGSKGRAYQSPQHHADNPRKGLRVRPREQESRREDPPAKAIRHYRVVRPRETELEGDRPPAKALKPGKASGSKGSEPRRDNPTPGVHTQGRVTRPRDEGTEVAKPPSKVRKSVQWVKSFFNRTTPTEGTASSQVENPVSPTNNNEEDTGARMETDPSQGLEQEAPQAQPPPTPMDES